MTVPILRWCIAFAGIGVLGAIALWAVGAYLSQPAPAAIGAAPADTGFGPLLMQSSTHQAIAGWIVRGKPGAGAVLLLHGVRGNRLDMLGRARFLAKLGYSVLLIDLPGHGESPAEHITFGVNEADGVRAALDYLARALPGEKIGVIGVSLGAASLVLAHARVEPSAVILESMYPTIAEAVEDRLRLHLGPAAPALAPLLLWQLPMRLGISADQLRPIDAIAAIHAPLLIVAGAVDRHTTLPETRRLFAAARAPKTLWIIDGAGHVDLHAFDRAAYEARVSAFLSRSLRAPESI